MTPPSIEITAELQKRFDHFDESVDQIIAAAADVRDYVNGTNQPTMADTLNQAIARMQDSVGGTV